MQTTNATMIEPLYAWLLERKMRLIEDLRLPLSLELWNGQTIRFHESPRVRITINQPSALKDFLKPTLANLGRAYVEGRIDVGGDISEAIKTIETICEHTQEKPKHHSILPFTFRRRNRKTDAEAIRYHYDVSNDFYKLWLDPNMVYSCAYFKDRNDGLDLAQEQKLDHICRKLRLEPSDRFLDVGCGWGGLIRWAAKNYGVDALGITISPAQYEYAKQRIREDGLESRCQVKLMDYRDLGTEGAFDKIASVGMFEHVGRKNLPLYFQKLRAALKDGGILLNHGITSRSINGRTKNFGGGEFIDRYVFPDGQLPHISLVSRDIEKQGLEIIDVESLRPHYARTLHHWHDRLSAQARVARQLVGEMRFRIWNVYLPGCAHSFERGRISVFQITAIKSTGGRYTYPLTRGHIYG